MTPFVDRYLDMVRDQRLPHLIPLTLVKRQLLLRALANAPKPTSIAVSLTIDVETDDGHAYNGYNAPSVAPFLEHIGQLADQVNGGFTLFVQGDLAVPYAEALRQLVPNHEIGLHGWHHELWGKPIWYSKITEQIPLDEKARRLQLAFDAFATAGLARPTSFRAPWLRIDDNVLHLLDQQGFVLDSAVFVARGAKPVIQQFGHLTRIPVSASPVPRLVRRSGIPVFTPYIALNMPTFLTASDENLLTLVGEIVTYQASVGCPPHLVILSHPWEYEPVAPRFAYQFDVYQRLAERFDWLATHYKTMLLPLSKLVV